MKFNLKEFLAMGEEEQCKVLDEHFEKREGVEWQGIREVLWNNTYPGRKVILTFLAFRLRHEITDEEWRRGLMAVYSNSFSVEELAELELSGLGPCHSGACIWLLDKNQPKLNIAAALQAMKEKE